MRMDVGAETNEQQPQLLKANYNWLKTFLSENFNVCLFVYMDTKVDMIWDLSL